MTIEQLWIEYMNVKFEPDWKKRISILEQCVAQDEDPRLAIMAKADLGLVYTAKVDGIMDIEKAKKILKEAAEEGSAPANFYMGNLLYNEGNFASFYYYADAVKYGNPHAANVLRENLNIKQENYMATRMVETTQEVIEQLVQQARWDIDGGKDADGSPQLALALVGLYDLGVKHGINREAGMMYLEEAIQKENENAIFMKNNPALMKPETIQQFTGHTQEDVKKVEKEVKKIQEKERKAELREMNRPGYLVGLILTGVGTLIRALPVLISPDTFESGFPSIAINVIGFLLTILGVRSTLICDAGAFFKVVLLAVHAVMAIFGTQIVAALIPVFTIVFLFWAWMIYSEDEGSSSPSSKSDWNPMKEYKEEHNCNNMPSCIYDESGNRWDKVSTYENGATYKNFDFGETSISYCDIKSKYATGSRGSFHWY